MGTGGSYNRRKSYGNYRYADFHSTCIGILYYIPGVRISAPKKQHIKRVTRTDVEEYAEEEIASSFIGPNENNDMIQI